jgi:hypothetical protein
MQDKPPYSHPHTIAYLVRRREQRTVGDVPSQSQQGIVRALPEPCGQRLAYCQPRDPPPHASQQPAVATYRHLCAQDRQRQPGHDSCVLKAAGVLDIEKPAVLVGYGSQEGPGDSYPQCSCQRVGGEPGKQKVQEHEALNCSHQWQKAEEYHRWKVGPAREGIAREGRARELVGVPCRDLARTQALTKEVVEEIVLCGGVRPEGGLAAQEVPLAYEGER